MSQVILLMGPTASGKTEIAVRLAERFPCDIISVDSAQVYRGMDIGTAKPDAETLRRAPHQLIDIREPEENYSAGDFVRDALAAIESSHRNGRVPLLAGGTMLYFRALTNGIAELPEADPDLRAAIDAEAAERGWPALHAELQRVDPVAASRLQPADRQRIQRALEVFRLTGQRISDLQSQTRAPYPPHLRFLRLGLQVEPRSVLHQRIERRLDAMLEAGLEAEVRTLKARPRLTLQHSSMRAVGYRQFWNCLDGRYDLDEARARTLFATRQLAKRQLTWLRGDAGVTSVDALDTNAIATISSYLVDFLDA